MAGGRATWRGSPKDDEESDESFVLSSDDEDDDVLADNSETRNSAVKRLVEDSNDGRLTPLIRKAIRRSLHRFTKESFDEDNDEENSERVLIPDSEEESDDVVQIVPKPRRKRVINLDSSDEEPAAADSNVEESSDEEAARDRPPRSNDPQQSLESADSGDSSPEENEAEQSVRSDGRISVDSSDESQTASESSSAEIQNVSDNSVEAEAVSENRVKAKVVPKSRMKAEVASTSRAEKEHSPENSREKEHSANNSVEEELAMSIATEESRNSSLDPLKAQKKAYLVHQKQQVERKLAKTKMLYNSGKIDLLPDRGEKLRLSILNDEKELETIADDLRSLELEAVSNAKTPKAEVIKKSLFKEGSLEIDPQYLKPTTLGIGKDLGKKAQETVERELGLTVERLKDLHGSLLGKPSEDQQAKDPRGLKVNLMPHQKYALTWLQWRETQNPSGGVLADDMGLGKTLTMISLLLASNAAKESGDASDDEEEEWLSSARAQRHLGGTLVVAPASLVAQWEAEVKNRCKRGLLSVELFHGNNREGNPKRLARNDIVITTYNIVARAFKTSGVLYKIRWRRVILDEAHVIRNHKSQTCESVCGLYASKRWVLTGTPVHNKEMDLFSILKFLRCSPFDDVRVWKRWVDNKNAAGHERLATVMKSIMLRRTKQELQANGTLDSLPEKMIEAIPVQLDPEERLVYDKVMVYSRTLFAQFLAQRAEKAHTFELGAGKYDKPSWMVTHKDTQFTKAQKKLLSMHADVEAHEILVLLLRLRQVCCHPSLIHSMLDKEDIEQNDLENVDDPAHLIQQLNNMSMYADEDEGETGVDGRVAENLLTSENPVFASTRKSSKMRAVIEKIEEIVNDKDKVIVVSQWVNVLEIVGAQLDAVKGATYRSFTGKVPVKDRQGIMDDFNSPHSKTNVLLLSLTAGGVGLNLVGANHLLLIDIHWNPQLECQAQDRIYRFGQKKNVFIYKYICVDTIEERIKALQDKKMEIADNLLSGGGKVASSKLSLDEMKSLFGM